MRLLIKDLSQSSNKNIGLIFLSLLVGLAAGFLASFYRLALSLAEKLGAGSLPSSQHSPYLWAFPPSHLASPCLYCQYLDEKIPYVDW